MSQGPKISVITPTLNAATTIEQNLRNVAGQTYRNVEHPSLDGASTDHTAEIVSAFRVQHPLTQFIQEKDEGLYDAMNKGIRACTGDYVFFLGSDDLFHDPDVLQDLVQMQIFTKERVVYGNVKIVGDTGWAKDGAIYDGRFSRKKLMKHNICHQSLFYPRTLLIKHGLFDTRYRINADWDMNWKLRRAGRFRYVDRIISIFHSGGCSTNGTDEAFKKDYLKKLHEYFRLSPGALYDLGKTAPWGDLIGSSEVSFPPVRQSLPSRIKSRIHSFLAS